MDKTILISLPIEVFQSFIIDSLRSSFANKAQKQPFTTEQPEILKDVLKSPQFLSLTKPLIDLRTKEGVLALMKRRKNQYIFYNTLLKHLKHENKKSGSEIDQETKLLFWKNEDQTSGVEKHLDVFIQDRISYFKNNYSRRLFDLLYEEPLTRRMAATRLGFVDQTYMVTQLISDWIKEDKARVVGRMTCSRSNRIVEAVTTNPKFFKLITLEQLRFDY